MVLAKETIEQLIKRGEKMRKVSLDREQILELIDSWRRSGEGSLEQKLIEDLFLLTETPLPLKSASRPSEPETAEPLI